MDRVIVIDDGLQYLPGNCRGCTVLGGIRPFVFARNCNLGIKEALADVNCEGVLLTNDDALLETPAVPTARGCQPARIGKGVTLQFRDRFPN